MNVILELIAILQTNKARKLKKKNKNFPLSVDTLTGIFLALVDTMVLN